MSGKRRRNPRSWCQFITGSGYKRLSIFENDDDKDEFVASLKSTCDKFGSLCLAWSLTERRFSVLVRASMSPENDLLPYLLDDYARNFNRRRRRVGRVFCLTSSSSVWDERRYLLELVRYVHLVPLRAACVADLKALDVYRWCGHAALVGNERQEWLHTDPVLVRFSSFTILARQRYREYMQLGLESAANSTFDEDMLAGVSDSGTRAPIRRRRARRASLGEG